MVTLTPSQPVVLCWDGGMDGWLKPVSCFAHISLGLEAILCVCWQMKTATTHGQRCCSSCWNVFSLLRWHWRKAPSTYSGERPVRLCILSAGVLSTVPCQRVAGAPPITDCFSAAWCELNTSSVWRYLWAFYARLRNKTSVIHFMKFSSCCLMAGIDKYMALWPSGKVHEDAFASQRIIRLRSLDLDNESSIFQCLSHSVTGSSHCLLVARPLSAIDLRIHWAYKFMCRHAAWSALCQYLWPLELPRVLRVEHSLIRIAASSSWMFIDRFPAILSGPPE